MLGGNHWERLACRPSENRLVDIMEWVQVCLGIDPMFKDFTHTHTQDLDVCKL